MKTIFVIDDSDTNLSMAEEALEKDYRVMTLPSAEKMFALMEKITPDLILLDIEMPEMNGFEALHHLKANSKYANIPVIFLTGRADASVEVQGFELGVVDFIIKPFSAPVLQNRIKMHLNVDGLIRERTAQLRQLQNSIVYILADLVENRDKETGGHIERTTAYVKILIEALTGEGSYADEIYNWGDFETVASSARLHDMGKIIISDLILNKTDHLTTEEYTLIKTHAEKGEEIIEHLIASIGEEEFLHNAKLFAGYHHEHWDGTGYPHGLKGDDIPLQGRIMAVADVYDALVSKRPYKAAYSHDDAVRIIMEEKGKIFDPSIADVFYNKKDLFKAITYRISH